jgi:hypothetical protein
MCQPYQLVASVNVTLEERPKDDQQAMWVLYWQQQ